MTLTRQHFKSLAEHIGTALIEMDKDILDNAQRKDILINELNAFCREFNGNFDAVKFEDAINKARDGEVLI